MGNSVGNSMEKSTGNRPRQWSVITDQKKSGRLRGYFRSDRKELEACRLALSVREKPLWGKFIISGETYGKDCRFGLRCLFVEEIGVLKTQQRTFLLC
jgi:hypothetical protein